MLKLAKKEPGIVVSAAVHVTALALLLFWLPSSAFPDAEEGIPVEMITEEMLGQITRGEKDAKEVTADKKPVVTRQADVHERKDEREDKRDMPSAPKRPADMKTDDKPVEPTSNPPPPPPPPPPPKKVEAEQKPSEQELADLVEQKEAEALAQKKAAEAKAKAEAEAKVKAKALADAQAAKAKAEADSKAKALADAQAAKAKAEADAKAKALADAQTAKAKAEADDKAKAVAAAKAREQAEAKARKDAELANKYDPGAIRALIQSKDVSQSTGSTGAEVNRTASLGTATGSAAKLSPSMQQQLVGLLRDQLNKCWDIPVVMRSVVRAPTPSVRFSVNPDGSLASQPQVVETDSDELFRVAADSAVRAVQKCSPLKIPAQFAPYYNNWKDLRFKFDIRDL